MPVTSYECLFLFDPTKAANDAAGLAAQVHATLEKHGAQIVVGRKWADNFKLAYAIDGHKKGYYYLTYFKAESTKIPAIEGDIRLSETILRHMVTKIEPKWEQEMLAVAQDETALGLRLMSEESAEGGALGEGVVPNQDPSQINPADFSRRPPRGPGGPPPGPGGPPPALGGPPPALGGPPPALGGVPPAQGGAGAPTNPEAAVGKDT